MPTVGDVMHALERVAPAQFAFPEDRVGLQIGSPASPVDRVVTSLDSSVGAAHFARSQGAQLLLCHHPLIWNPLKTVLDGDYDGRRVAEVIRAGLSFIGAHTNWDAAPGGINDVLGELIGLSDLEAFGSSNRVKRLQLVTFVPEEALDAVIDALSEAGAGTIGLYRRCAFYGPGVGTFVAEEGADPAIGSVGGVEHVQEVRLEMVVPESRADAVAAALVRAHPYEQPAFHLEVLRSPLEQPAGRIGVLDSPMSFSAFVDMVDERVETKSLGWGAPAKSVRRVAVVGGAAAGDWQEAMRCGADAMLTGEVPQHVALEAAESGFCIVAGGHYATENPGTRRLGEVLAGLVEGVEFVHYEPEPGLSGRPLG